MNALKYMEAVKIEEIASHYQETGYLIVVHPIEIEYAVETKLLPYHLTVKSEHHKQAIQVTTREDDDQSVEQLMTLRDQAYREGFDRFRLTIAGLKDQTETQIEQLDQEICHYLAQDVPDHLAELPAKVQIEKVDQVGLDSLSVMVSGMRVVGNGVVTVGLENGYVEKKEEGWQFDFPLSFDVELDHDLHLKVVHDIATDTSSFYASDGRSALLVDGEQV